MDCLFTCLGQPIVAPMPQVQGGKDIMKHSYEQFRPIDLLIVPNEMVQSVKFTVSIFGGDGYFNIKLFS